MKEMIEQFFKGKVGYVFNYKDLKECMELIDAMFADKKQLEDKINKTIEYIKNDAKKTRGLIMPKAGLDIYEILGGNDI